MCCDNGTGTRENMKPGKASVLEVSAVLRTVTDSAQHDNTNNINNILCFTPSQPLQL